ncbi:DUF1217 domain-containing protein [Agrobacterium vitis]|uniref:DUF1217 domain-containing protein n=1 Tax=Agrobacterium vitis TaxID=373 RepID=UPI000872819F|nr:DUF1217 domain-containing protein [Agrobacterium vitis]MCE6074878.1 DUF1217 domain-containing protein [Agrobacterium vitis]MCM2467717.1 DUF1217 domain-containing protein [Agrobacterium vitis]MUO68378.1 DUF1217 domain-containing protein [Agrobacterium vitis]MUO83404.1 DUF1217 domain-containing protein [Agrobacterium vitis]
MVSTYIGYDLVNRDMKASLKRVSQEPEVAREQKYYQENIGKVKTVDDFMNDDRLYQYTMKANGLEDMTYAKAFMKKVLESDLSDENSYANKLSDDRYRDFARSFNFSAETADIQTDKQEEDVIGLYKQSLVTEGDDAKEEVQYYDSAIDKVTNVDDLLKNSRLTKFVLESYGLDTKYYSTDHLKKILTSDVNDSTSYVNTLTTNKSDYLKIANAFSFNTDGSLKNATAQTSEQKTAMEDLYLEEVPSTETAYRAEREAAYYKEKIATVTKASDITGDSRLFSYAKTALGMDKNTLKSTFENIVSSDLNDPTSYANTQGKVKGDYAKVAAMFNFDTSGNATAGNAQSETQLAQTATGYMTNYDDQDEADLSSLTTYYSTQMKSITKVDDLLGNEKIYDMVMKAYGIETDEFSKADLKKVLTSDMNDPKSYANKTRDERLISLASAFNFKEDGTADVPLLAQSERTITEVAKDYIVQKTRFLEGKEQTDAKTAAEADSKYYQENIVKVTSVTDLLKDRKLVDFALTAQGLDPKDVSDDMLKQLFSSDLTDPKSFANTQADEGYAKFVASYNFDSSGKISQENADGVQNRSETFNTENLYLHQTLENEQGESDQGVRLALYWDRMSSTITSAYDILGDTALLEVFRTAYSLPSDMSNMDIEQQKKVIEKKMDLKDLSDPEKQKKFLQRFTAMYDLENNTGSSANAALTILGGSSSTSGISASLLESVNSL